MRAAILGKAEFGVSRVCLFYWMRRARGELRLVSGRVRRTLPAPRNARLVLEIHENSAIVVLEDSCDILHKSSVSPSWRRTSPADVHPIDGKGGLNVEDSSVPIPTWLWRHRIGGGVDSAPARCPNSQRTVQFERPTACGGNLPCAW